MEIKDDKAKVYARETLERIKGLDDKNQILLIGVATGLEHADKTG